LIDFDFRFLAIHLRVIALASNFCKQEVTVLVDPLLLVSTEAHFWINHSKNQAIAKTINIS